MTVLNKTVLTAVNYCPIYHINYCSNTTVIYCINCCFSIEKQNFFFIIAVIYCCNYFPNNRNGILLFHLLTEI